MFLILRNREDMQAALPRPILGDLRAQIARLERRGAVCGRAGAVAFGAPEIDGYLSDGGLVLGALHEIAGAGAEAEHGTAAALLVGGLLARTQGKVVWTLARRDLFAPALAAVGLKPDRVIYVEAGRAASTLLVMEEGLRHRGLAAVVGEVSGRLTLTTSRRLQLAAETSGVIAVAIRRSRAFNDPALAEPTAAVTRWRIAALPSEPPVPHAPNTPGLGRARWRLDLTRCRGGEPHSWIVEACDATGRLAVVSDLADRSAAPERRRLAG
jgi:protein ImuA